MGIEDKMLEDEFSKFLRTVYEMIENEEDEDKKAIRSYAWLSLQALFEIKSLYKIIEQQNRQILKELKTLNKKLEKWENEEISKKQETILHYVKLNSDKLNALIKAQAGS